MAADVAEGLAFLASIGVLHSDVKVRPARAPSQAPLCAAATRPPQSPPSQGRVPTCAAHPPHPPLQAGNVLLSDDLRAALGDLGVARAVAASRGSVAGFCCTHAAPEQIMGLRCGVAADMYRWVGGRLRLCRWRGHLTPLRAGPGRPPAPTDPRTAPEHAATACC